MPRPLDPLTFIPSAHVVREKLDEALRSPNGFASSLK